MAFSDCCVCNQRRWSRLRNCTGRRAWSHLVLCRLPRSAWPHLAVLQVLQWTASPVSKAPTNPRVTRKRHRKPRLCSVARTGCEGDISPLVEDQSRRTRLAIPACTLAALCLLRPKGGHASCRRSGPSNKVRARYGLTPQSRRGPTASHLAQPAGEAYHPSGRAKRLAAGPASPRTLGSTQRRCATLQQKVRVMART